MLQQTVSKSEFAGIIGVSAARVSQYIAEGKIHGAALIGDGRAARIDVEVARAQLGRSLQPGGMMGKSLRPDQPARPLALPSGPIAEDDHQARYQKARADAAEIEAERARRRELEERGVYVRAAEAKAAWARELTQLLEALDAALPDMARRIDGEKPADAKALTAALRREIREFRKAQSEAARDRAGTLAELVTDGADSGEATDDV